MKIDVDDLNRLAMDLSAAGPKALPPAARAVEKASRDIERDAKIACFVRTGNLRSSISTDLSVTDTSVTAEIGPTASYGGYVESGTSRAGPRPYLGPAFSRHADLLVHALDEIAARTAGM